MKSLAMSALGWLLLVLIIACPFLIRCATMKQLYNDEKQCLPVTAETATACVQQRWEACGQGAMEWLVCMKKAHDAGNCKQGCPYDVAIKKDAAQ